MSRSSYPTVPLSGFIHQIFDIEDVTSKYRKRMFILNFQYEGEKFPEQIRLTLTQDNVHLLDGFAVGAKVTVKYVLRGRGYPKDGITVYYNTLEVVSVEPDRY